MGVDVASGSVVEMLEREGAVGSLSAVAGMCTSGRITFCPWALRPAGARAYSRRIAVFFIFEPPC
jgi:hypothetical protein